MVRAFQTSLRAVGIVFLIALLIALSALPASAQTPDPKPPRRAPDPARPCLNPFPSEQNWRFIARLAQEDVNQHVCCNWSVHIHKPARYNLSDHADGTEDGSSEGMMEFTKNSPDLANGRFWRTSKTLLSSVVACGLRRTILSASLQLAAQYYELREFVLLHVTKIDNLYNRVIRNIVVLLAALSVNMSSTSISERGRRCLTGSAKGVGSASRRRPLALRRPLSLNLHRL